MRRYGGIGLALLCAVTLLAGMLTPLSVMADTSARTAVEANSVDKILERDGYLEGVWYPWFNWYQIACNLGNNATMESLLGGEWWKSQPQYQGGIDRYGVERIYCDLINMKAIGYNIIGFNGSMQGEGVIYDNNGDVLGIEEQHLRNITRFLDICRELDVAIMWNVHFHSEGLLDSYNNGKPAWDLMTQMYCNPVVTEHYVERYVRPLCKVLAQYPDVVVMASAMDESDNEINDSDIGNHFAQRQTYGVTEAAMVNFVTRVTDVLREELPDVKLTLASNDSDFTRYNHMNLDFMGRSMYGDGTGYESALELMSAAPVIATEFGLGSLVSEEQYSSIHLAKRQAMMEEGYKGWFMWSWQSDVGGGHYDVMLQEMKHFADFRPMVYDLHEFILDYRASHRGETVVLDAPSMFYNAGDTKVTWIPSRQASKMDLLRSDDGGKTWKALLKDADPSHYVDENGRGAYTDTTAPKSGYMYKIVVRDGKGNEAESAPTNEPEDAKEFFTSKDYSMSFGGGVISDPPVMPDQVTETAKSGALPLTSLGTQNNRPINVSDNLILNGSFEEAQGGQWNGDFLCDTVTVVEDATTRFGNKSLYFNTSGVSKAAWHTFWVDVEPDTDYTFSAWVKGAFISDDNRYTATIGVMDPNTMQYMRLSGERVSTATRQLVPPSWDNEWHLLSATFNSGNRTKVGVALYGHSSQLWVDDVALFVSNAGIKYTNPDYQGSFIAKMYGGESGCVDEDNLVGDFRMDEVGSEYWQTGHGYKNGFISIQENTLEYGNSLKYTAGEGLGNVYFKWVDLKPHTEYVFSMSLKVLESGGGRFSLATRTPRGTITFLDLDFDQDLFGEEWINYQVMFDSGAFDRVALVVFDLGGSALIDNVRIFEMDKAIYVEDEYLEDKQGWFEDEDGWRYYENGKAVTNAWKKDDSGWRYLGADGYCVTNRWVKDSAGWCYLGADGYAVTNTWKKDSVGWCYLNGSGSMTKNAWVKDGGKWYFLDKNGYMVTNAWKKDSVGWVYLGSNGAMLTNAWCKDSQGWCYVGANGYAVTNCWKKDSHGWIWLNASGSMTKNAWIKDNGKWYYLDGNGYMVTNAWKKDSKGWVYMGSDGAMKTNAWVKDSKGWCYVGSDGYAVTNCWKKDSKGWIWLDENGSMKKNAWVYDKGWYYVDSEGYMVYSTSLTIKGEKYNFNASGLCTNP